MQLMSIPNFQAACPCPPKQTHSCIFLIILGIWAFCDNLQSKT
jgi:hypothetical protein